MARHEPIPPGIVVALVLVLAVFWGLILYLTLRSGPGERPADLTPTPSPPVVVVTTEPTRPVVVSPTATVTPVPEVLLTTPTRTPLPPVLLIDTPTPTLTPTIEGTRVPTQRG